MEQKLSYKDIQNIVSDKLIWGSIDNKLGKFAKYQNVSGVYAISVDSAYVYIGQSINLLQRMLEHCYMMKFPDKISIYQDENYKYKMLHDVMGRVIINPLLVLEEYNKKQLDAIEALYIRMYLPYFNVAIPKLNGEIDYYKDFSTELNDLLIWVHTHGIMEE